MFNESWFSFWTSLSSPPHLVDTSPILHQKLPSYLPPSPREGKTLLPRTHTEFPLRSLRKNSIKFGCKCFPVLLRIKLFDKFTTILKNILFNPFSRFVCPLMEFSQMMSYHAIFPQPILFRQNSSISKGEKGRQEDWI